MNDAPIPEDLHEVALELAAQAVWAAAKTKIRWRDVGHVIREECISQATTAVSAYLEAIRKGSS